MTKFRLCYTYHFVMFVVLLLQIMYLIRGSFCNMPDSKNTDKSRQAFLSCQERAEADGVFGSYECKVRGALYFAGQGTQQQWAIKKERCSHPDIPPAMKTCSGLSNELNLICSLIFHISDGTCYGMPYKFISRHDTVSCNFSCFFPSEILLHPFVRGFR